MKTKKSNYNLGDPSEAIGTRPILTEPAPQLIATPKVDGRTMRRTGRTAQFNVMLSPDFREQISRIADLDRLTYPQLLAVMLRAYTDLSPETKNAYITDIMATWGK